jgi:S-DNA-T family DNA segregation ATPase FtsK/SpoIIIE
MLRASVTECHLCQRCPRLLAYHVIGKSQAWRVGLKGDGHFPGSVFHERIAKPFYRAVASESDNPIKSGLVDLLAGRPDDLTAEVHGLLQDHILAPYLEENAATMPYETMLSLGRGVELWAKHLAAFLDQQPTGDRSHVSNLAGQVFCDPEAMLTAVTELEDGRSFQLRGRFDCLLVDQGRHEVVLVEFKGLRPNFYDEELVQVGLYGWLVRQSTGLQPRGVVLYLDEDEPEVVYTSDELARMTDGLPNLFRTTADVKERTGRKGSVELPGPSHPFLCYQCPFDGACDRDWGSRRGAEPEVATPGGPGPEEIDDGREEAAELLEKVVQVLEVLKLPVEPHGFIVGPRLVRVQVRPLIEKGTTVRKIMNRAEDLQVALSLESPPLIQPHAGYVGLDAPRRVITPLTLGELVERGQDERPDSVVAFPLGMGVDGSVLWADLAEPTMTSILVAGTSGSGKSIFLRAVVIALAMEAGPDEVQFTLIDPKRVTFTDLGDLPHLRRPASDGPDPAGPIIMDIQAAAETLDVLVREMEERYQRFNAYGVADVESYNRTHQPLPHQVVVIDEYADLMTDKELKGLTESGIQRLCQMGRAAGFHIILSTQRPDAKVVTPLIKANLQLKVALKVTTAANSQIIIDQPGAERLIGKGDMLIGGALPVARLQGALPTQTEIRAAMKRG